MPKYQINVVEEHFCTYNLTETQLRDDHGLDDFDIESLNDPTTPYTELSRILAGVHCELLTYCTTPDEDSFETGDNFSLDIV